MRLAKLHLSGFKSFPDRSELGFDHGVTAIVGPNGCGKSNVVDAITWVLGEQSAKSLRGERMEDIIFNGSDARKPTSAAEVRLKLTNVAQASMTVPEEGDPLLDDTPIVTRDVEIGRRLYRSGESEYLIDGEVCRLRDVHDLLMDSGLGVKAYAVIEQGKIGQILSSRPAERRMLIEEAAGVTKYKSRRRAAELKLEAAQLNLTRIDDIVFEVEKQRGALKRQAARARRYKRLREELRRWEQVQFAHRHDALAKEIEAAEARLADARARETAAAAHLAELEATLESVRLALTSAESDATSTRERAHACELEIGRRQQQIQFEKLQIEELARQAESLGTEVAELESRREPAQLAITAQREAADRARLAKNEAEQRVSGCVEDYSRAYLAVQAAEHDADEIRAAVLGAGTTLSALRQARDNAAAVRDRVAAERGRLEMERRDLATEGDRARREGESATQALADARAELEAITSNRQAADTALISHRHKRERLGQELGARHRELAAKDARLRSLEGLEASRATYGDATRFLLARDREVPRSRGAVADHLDVERSYERAVDALLGDLLQHVLVDDMQDAIGGLAALEAHAAGRCGFVVLADLVRATDVAADDGLIPASHSATAHARTLASVVRAVGPHAELLTTLIGDAYIVDSFEAARALSRDVAVPVAALTGEVFRGAARVEGGSRRDAQGILELRAEVLRLREEVKVHEHDAHELANEITAVDLAVLNAGTELRTLVDRQHTQDKLSVSLDSQRTHAADALARISRRVDLVDTERRRADEEERTAEQRREEAVAAITMHEAQQFSAEGQLGEVMARLQSAREAAESRMRLVTEARTEQATLVERVSVLDIERVRLEEAAADLETRVTGRRGDIHRTEVRREELHTSIRETEALLDQDVSTIQSLKEQLRGLDETVTTLRTQFSAGEHDIRGARHTLESVRSRVMQSEVERATAASDLAHLAATCLEAVNISIDEVVVEVARMERDGELVAPAKRLAAASAVAEDEEDESADAPSAIDAASDITAVDADARLSPEQVIGDLRKKIDRLGPVNMMAIEQFDELEARHTFLTTQRKDLLSSIAQTGEAIKKIDKTTRERFEQAFTQINEHFQGTFTTLFGGGRAGLVLIDQEDSEESGIDIIAQPPGKRLQNVQLLSGGEKAMTAMGLMFAIFRYRPSPFCLLDEIDAPLDDANIGRFVEMLASMQHHTQFILITHNRKTMEIADRLYGVTMEEPGVSKLISLQMN